MKAAASGGGFMPSRPARDAHIVPAFSLQGLLLLPLAMALPILANGLGGLFTMQALQTWYPALAKPFFIPPDIVFPLVWTFIYALMTLAFWRILRVKAPLGKKSTAFGFFLLQLSLNIGWSYAFFGQQSPRAGLVVVSLLFIAITLTIRAFRRLDGPAGYAFYPCLVWVGFAGILNAAIVILNP